MNKYMVILRKQVPALIKEEICIEAENLKEAVELALDGEGTIVLTELCEYDCTDTNSVECVDYFELGIE